MSWVNLYFSLYPFFLYRYRVNWPHKHNADFPTLLLRQMFSQADMVMARVIWAQVCVFSCSRHLIVLPVLLLCHILYIIFQPKLLSYWSNQILSFVFDHLLSAFWLDLVQSALFGKWAKQRAETFFFISCFFQAHTVLFWISCPFYSMTLLSFCHGHLDANSQRSVTVSTHLTPLFQWTVRLHHSLQLLRKSLPT